MPSDILKKLRLLGHIEGGSLLLLLFVAMPLKYLANQPDAVRIVGTAHGFLWIAYLIALAVVWRVEKWPFQTVFLGGVASVLPFGPWVFDRYLQRTSQA